MGILVGGGTSVLHNAEDVGAASDYGRPIGRCTNSTHRTPPHVLRQGGRALPGLPASCATANEHQLRGLSKSHRPHIIKLKHSRQLHRLGEVLHCCDRSLCKSAEASHCRLQDLPVAWSPRWWESWSGPIATGVYFTLILGCFNRTWESNIDPFHGLGRVR